MMAQDDELILTLDSIRQHLPGDFSWTETFISSLYSPCCTSPVSDIQSALSSDSSPSESDSTSLLWNTIHSDSPTSNSIYSTLELDFPDYEAKPEITHFPDLTPTLSDQHKKQGIRRPEMVFNPKAVGRHYRGVQRRPWGKFAVEIRDPEWKGVSGVVRDVRFGC
ncbi:hypothetical protein RJ639_029965 [Escallonia herrerae]|uniref:AP2/ERF domain-containing protein n=1 Tax=Escallonia herrerae TaxID=1293975 RepID=A0AA88X3M9_9ASTE|nr:hypothetical protein RJ639_029965 [Escallonia herrerae]